MDGCERCFKRNGIGDISCQICGEGIMSGKWDGPTIEYTCKSCKMSIVGASFYTPCERDESKYQVRIASERLSSRQMIKIGKYLHVPVLQLKEMIQDKKVIDKKFYLHCVVEFSDLLKEIGVSYEITPQIPYSQYENCNKRMVIHRMDE